MKFSTLFLQIDFNYLFCIIPGTTSVCKKYCLEKSEECDCYKIADKEIWVEEGKRQSKEEHDNKDIEHTLLCILGTYLNNLFAVFYRCLRLVEVYVLLDKDDRPISTCCNRLCRSASKPVDNCTSHEKAKYYLGVNKAQRCNDIAIHIFEQYYDTKYHCCCPNDCCTNKNRFGSSLECISSAVSLFKIVFGSIEIGFKTEILFNLCPNIRQCLNP